MSTSTDHTPLQPATTWGAYTPWPPQHRNRRKPARIAGALGIATVAGVFVHCVAPALF